MCFFHTQYISDISYGRVVAGWKNATSGPGEIVILILLAGRMGREPCAVAQLHAKREV